MNLEIYEYADTDRRYSSQDPMQTQTQLQRNVISLKGSAQIVSEFFQYGVNKCVKYILPPIETIYLT